MMNTIHHLLDVCEDFVFNFITDILDVTSLVNLFNDGHDLGTNAYFVPPDLGTIPDEYWAPLYEQDLDTDDDVWSDYPDLVSIFSNLHHDQELQALADHVLTDSDYFGSADQVESIDNADVYQHLPELGELDLEISSFQDHDIDDDCIVHALSPPIDLYQHLPELGELDLELSFCQEQDLDDDCIVHAPPPPIDLSMFAIEDQPEFELVVSKYTGTQKRADIRKAQDQYWAAYKAAKPLLEQKDKAYAKMRDFAAKLSVARAELEPLKQAMKAAAGANTKLPYSKEFADVAKRVKQHSDNVGKARLARTAATEAYSKAVDAAILQFKHAIERIADLADVDFTVLYKQLDPTTKRSAEFQELKDAFVTIDGYVYVDHIFRVLHPDAPAGSTAYTADRMLAYRQAALKKALPAFTSQPNQPADARVVRHDDKPYLMWRGIVASQYAEFSDLVAVWPTAQVTYLDKIMYVHDGPCVAEHAALAAANDAIVKLVCPETQVQPVDLSSVPVTTLNNWFLTDNERDPAILRGFAVFVLEDEINTSIVPFEEADKPLYNALLHHPVKPHPLRLRVQDSSEEFVRIVQASLHSAAVAILGGQSIQPELTQA